MRDRGATTWRNELIDDGQRPNVGQFTMAQPSPRFMLTCAVPTCQKKHDSRGSKLWIAGTKLRMCAACAEAREMRRKERVEA